MSVKLLKSLSAGLVACILLGSGEAPKQEKYSFFIASPVIKNELADEAQKLLVLDADDEEIEYSFKLAEIFRNIFEKYN